MSIVFIVFSTPATTQLLVDGLKDGSIHSSIQGTPEQVAAIIQGSFLIAGCCIAPGFIFGIVSGIVSTLGIKKHTPLIYVLNIIFGFVSGVLLNVVAGILGLVAPNKD